MSVTQSVVGSRSPGKLHLHLGALDLDALADLKGSALEAILAEVNGDAATEEHARHSSHSSYSTHGTAMW